MLMLPADDRYTTKDKVRDDCKQYRVKWICYVDNVLSLKDAQCETLHVNTSLFGLRLDTRAGVKPRSACC